MCSIACTETCTLHPTSWLQVTYLNLNDPNLYGDDAVESTALGLSIITAVDGVRDSDQPKLQVCILDKLSGGSPSTKCHSFPLACWHFVVHLMSKSNDLHG